MLHTVEVGSFRDDLIAALSNNDLARHSRFTAGHLARGGPGWDRILPWVQHRSRGTGLSLCVRRPVDPLSPEGPALRSSKPGEKTQGIL